jgi:putative addiction module killer protein
MVDKLSFMKDNDAVFEIRQTDQFSAWFKGLRDRKARSRILVRVDHLALGHAGDVRPVGEGVSELRIDHGPGYRVYFVRGGPVLIVLLAGGDKGSQDRDIRSALALARSLAREVP